MCVWVWVGVWLYVCVRVCVCACVLNAQEGEEGLKESMRWVLWPMRTCCLGLNHRLHRIGCWLGQRLHSPALGGTKQG